MSAAQMASVPVSGSSHFDYKTVTGYFMQDDPLTDPITFDYTAVNFGLINRTYPAEGSSDGHNTLTQWQRFARYVETLNHKSEEGVTYKVLFLARHGEGFHNVAESYYGTAAWDCYWAQQEGNGTIVWADALLTETGTNQALKGHALWSSLLVDQHIPAPQAYYASPLTRCMLTANLTFGGLALPADRSFLPTVLEALREDVSTHTCDRRSSRTAIHARFPAWPIEPGFAEHDQLWTGRLAETVSGRHDRLRRALDHIFSAAGSKTWISVTSHSGAIRSALEVLGHRRFDLGTGQAIPVLVEARQRAEPYPPSTEPAWEEPKLCDGPPPMNSAGQSTSGQTVPAPTGAPAEL